VLIQHVGTIHQSLRSESYGETMGFAALKRWGWIGTGLKAAWRWV